MLPLLLSYTKPKKYCRVRFTHQSRGTVFNGAWNAPYSKNILIIGFGIILHFAKYHLYNNKYAVEKLRHYEICFNLLKLNHKFGFSHFSAVALSQPLRLA